MARRSLPPNEGVVKLNCGVVFTAPGIEPLTFGQLELSLGDLTVYATVAGQCVPIWSIELLPTPVSQRQAVNTPDMTMRWLADASKIFSPSVSA